MARPTRDEALTTLREGYDEIHRLLEGVSDEDLSRPRTIGGGEWSAKDLLGHVASWEEIALQALAEWRDGRRPAIEDVFTSHAVDRVNEENIAAKAPLPPDDVQIGAEETHHALIDVVEGMRDDEWNSRAPYPTERRETLGALLGSITGAPQRPFGHAFAHLHELRDFVESLRA